MLQSIPSARDPWVILQQTAGIAMDRENIGGNMSGQQSNYVSRGGNPTNNKWSLDGVDITDMAATGASPSYYDFDAFEEMTINTGGVDVTQQTGGVGINLVTKSGTRPVPRLVALLRHQRAASSRSNITDAQRLQGATSGNPIQDIQDYGIEAGGPLIRKGARGSGAPAARTTSTSASSTSISRRAAVPADQGRRDRGNRCRIQRRRRQRLPEHRPRRCSQTTAT